jgi:4a-hydroxytetrahydrobiopterin dehydratase
MSIEALRAQHCVPRKGKDAGVDAGTITGYLGDLPGWSKASDGGSIAKTFKFDDYFHTMAFVNAVASIAHREDHHPDLGVHYDRCVVQYSTHDVGGLSLNDFICAAKVEDLVAGAK